LGYVHIHTHYNQQHILYIVTLPSRRASIRPGNLYGARAERPRQKEIARAVSKSPERRVRVMFRATINLYFFIFLCIILYVGQPAGKPPEEEEEGFFCDDRHGAHEFRAESGGSAWGSGQRRVAGGFRPCSRKRKSDKETAIWDQDLGAQSASPSEDGGRKTCLRKTTDSRVAKIRNFKVIGAVTAPDTALSRGAVIPRVSRRYWPWIRAPLRAGLSPLGRDRSWIARSRGILWCGRL